MGIFSAIQILLPKTVIQRNLRYTPHAAATLPVLIYRPIHFPQLTRLLLATKAHKIVHRSRFHPAVCCHWETTSPTTTLRKLRTLQLS
jgi:hypothetical protein